MRHALRARQRGVALLALLAVLVLGASWYLVSELNSNTSNRLAIHRAHNAKVLETAKRALLGWAAQNASNSADINPGRLPCPEDTATIYNPSTEGTAAATCADASSRPVIGRLPWRTLGIPKLLDASGEPLWYVVSNGWKLDASGSPIGINSNSAGQLTLGTQTPVALIIAPGPAINILPTVAQTAAGCVAREQKRSLTSPTLPDYRDYLECENATSPVDATFVTAIVGNSDNPVLNDQLVPVTAPEVMNAIEGPVAKRIETDVVPKLVATYVTNAAQWGGTSTAPVFPFATTFGNPSVSSFKGVVNTTQGLLPMTGSSCSGLMSTHCDSTFVQWSTASISVTKTGGTASMDSAVCTSSTANQVRCVISYSRFCLLAIFAPCNGTISVSVNATAQNVGMALREFDQSQIGGFASITSSTTPIAANGSATASVQGSLTTASCTPVWLLFLGLYLCSTSDTATVTIPIAVFKDHPLNTATSADAWYWFSANRWYDVTYYAVAASHLPNGAHNCSTGGDCLCVFSSSCASIANGTAPRNIRALLALAGRSLNGTVGSNRLLTDFLETTENNTTLDWKFTSATINKTFNDRFVTVSSY